MKTSRLFFLLFLFSQLAIAQGEAPEQSQIPDFLQGAIVPLVTPYRGANAENIDLQGLARLTDYLSTTRASALFPVSGTGQWDLLSVAEKKEIIATTIKAAQSRKAILAGVGSPNNIEEVLDVAQFAEKAGASAIVAVTPEFVRRHQPKINGEPRIKNQPLLLAYYGQVAQAVKLPVVVYDPESELEPATMKELVERFPNIKAMKLREKINITKFRQMVDAVHGKASILSGSEIYALVAMKEGAQGMIGNGLNLYPDLGMELVDACRLKKWDQAEKIQQKIIEANHRMEELGGGAQGIKKILNDVIGVPMNTINRGDTFRPEPKAGYYEDILNYYRELKLPHYKVHP